MAKPPGHLDVPSVTQGDLLSFHSKHFGANPHSQVISAISQSSDGNNELYDNTKALWDAEEENLSCYPDGTPRTLTEEQIAIFRHSEIEQLVKSYNAYLQDLEEHDSKEESQHDDEPSQKLENPLDFFEFAETVRQKHVLDQARKLARSELNQDTAQETINYVPKSREEKKLQKRRNRNKRRKLIKDVSRAYADANDEAGRTFRRIAREQDEQKVADDIMLDY